MDKVAAAKARVPKTQSEARKVLAAARRAEEAAYREAQRLRNEFLVRLKEFRVLDPACGSGNFLYVALKALKDIEHRANIDAETLGLDKATPRSEEHTSELQSLMRISYAVFCLKKKITHI